jgi:hypothetical protein
LIKNGKKVVAFVPVSFLHHIPLYRLTCRSLE